MAIVFTLYPDNDLQMTAILKQVNTVTHTVTTLTSGDVSAFLATSTAPTATAADPSLVTTCTYSTSAKNWLISFDGGVLTPSLLSALFGASPTSCYCIVTANDTDVRAYIEGMYVASRPVNA